MAAPAGSDRCVGWGVVFRQRRGRGRRRTHRAGRRKEPKQEARVACMSCSLCAGIPLACRYLGPQGGGVGKGVGRGQMDGRDGVPMPTLPGRFPDAVAGRVYAALISRRAETLWPDRASCDATPARGPERPATWMSWSFRTEGVGGKEEVFALLAARVGEFRSGVADPGCGFCADRGSPRFRVRVDGPANTLITLRGRRVSRWKKQRAAQVPAAADPPSPLVEDAAACETARAGGGGGGGGGCQY